MFRIMEIRSSTQTMVKPNTRRMMPATILPSEKRVRAPQIQEVKGKMARSTLTI